MISLPAPFHDPELEALRADIRDLEQQVRALKEQKQGLLSLVERFCSTQLRVLGELTRRLLQRALARLEAALAENPDQQGLEEQVALARFKLELFAEQESGGGTKSLLCFDLEQAEREQLKRDFREAVQICHPDHAPPRLKEKADRVCRALVLAYKSNDLLAVQDMLLQLQTEGLSGTKPLSQAARALLERRRDTVRRRVLAEQRAVAELEASAAYQKAAGIPDWDAFFAAAKARLQEQLDGEA